MQVLTGILAGRAKTARKWFAAIVLFAFAAWVFPVHADPVKVRAAAHDGYGRLVFNWPRRVPYTVTMEGNRLVIKFGRRIESDVEPAVRALRKYLSAGQISADGRSVVFTVVGSFGINDFDLGNAVVVDIVENAPTAAKPVQETKPAQDTPVPTPLPALNKHPSFPSQKVLIADVQDYLAQLGYAAGPADGIIGRKTRDAIEAFQRDQGLPVTGEPTKTLAKLMESKLTARQDRPRPASPPPAAPLQVGDLGTFNALIIGNDAYRALPRLQTAVKDAKAVAELLEIRYGFRATTLTNATRDEVIQALEKLRRELTDQDNLLIYYAGHGQLDREADRGYWLPIDATEDSQANWLNNVTITDTLKAIRAKHVMVVADSCYSGTLTRDTRGIEVRLKKSDYIAKTHRKKSRTVLASGGLEPVSDSGGSGHSVFAKAFMDALRDNEGVIDGLDVFSYVRRQVRLNADQVPNYANIRYAGHEVGGDFLFARKPEHRSEAKQDKPTIAAIRPAPVSQPSSPVKPAVGIFPKTYKPGDIFKDCPHCPEMVVIPPGSFHMGDLSGEGLKEERPVRTVSIPYRFAVGKYEVTQAEWQAVMGWNPSKFKGERNPVERVSWNEAKEFVRELSAKTGKTYRLLSEAEWEYMARAGSTTKYPWGDSAASSQAKGGGGKMVPVGSYRPNAFGVYDTVGNVHEWTEDCWHNSYEGATADGRAWTTGGNCSRRVLRGVSGNGRKSWNADRDEKYWDFSRMDLVDDTGNMTAAGTVLWAGDSASRDAGGAVSRHGYIGFRVARTLD